MPRIEILRDVPDSEVDEVMQDFRDDGATNVRKDKQLDGKWTVTATYPDQ